MKVSVYEAKSRLSEMIKKALDGEDVVITRNGEITVRLVPVPKQNSWVGIAHGQGEVLDSFFAPLDDDDTSRSLTGGV